MRIYVLQVTGATDAAGATTTWTFATKSIAGLPAGWMARIVKPGNFERHAWGRASVSGAPAVDFGVGRLNNRDGALDALLLAGIDGREVTLWRGEERSVTDAATGRRRDPSFAELELYLSGTAAGSSYANGEIQLQLRNRQGELASLPVQTERYAGDNAGSAGLEGTADDLKDLLKPIWLGWNENVPVPEVNPSRHIFQLSSNDVVPIEPAAPSVVKDKGVELTATTIEVTGITAFAATGGPSGQLWWHGSAAGWYIRTEAAPDGTVTVDAQEGSAATTTAAQLSARLLRAHGVAEGALAGLGALDAASPEPIGIWIGLEERRIGEVLADLLAGAVATWTDDRDGVFMFGRLEVPAVEPDHVIRRDQLHRGGGGGGGEGFRILGVSEPGSPLPISEAVVWHRRNWQVQTGDDLAGAATAAFRAFAAVENRKTVADNSGVRVKHLLARPWERQTLFTTAAQAATAGARYVDLFGVRRFFLEVDLGTEDAAAIRFLQTVSLPIGRLDFDSRTFRVIGIVDDLDTQTEPSVTTLILWG